MGIRYVRVWRRSVGVDIGHLDKLGYIQVYRMSFYIKIAISNIQYEHDGNIGFIPQTITNNSHLNTTPTI